jgi:hypothetical protein
MIGGPPEFAMPLPFLRFLAAPLPLLALLLALTLVATPAPAAAAADDDDDEEETMAAPGRGIGGGIRLLNGPAIGATGRFAVVAGGGGGGTFRPVERRSADAPDTPVSTRPGLARRTEVTVVRPVLAPPAPPALKSGQPPRNGGPPPGAAGERPR